MINIQIITHNKEEEEFASTNILLTLKAWWGHITKISINSKESKFYTFRCKKCRSTFRAKGRNSKFCPNCKIIYQPKNVIVKCKLCGKEFKRVGNQKYCIDCKGKSYKVYKHNCNVCGKEFIGYYETGRCSDCRGTKINSPKEKGTLYSCKDCGIPFPRKKSLDSVRCPDCLEKFRNKPSVSKTRKDVNYLTYNAVTGHKD